MRLVVVEMVTQPDTTVRLGKLSSLHLVAFPYLCGTFELSRLLVIRYSRSGVEIKVFSNRALIYLLE
jgi:hypothetical protein